MAKENTLPSTKVDGTAQVKVRLSPEDRDAFNAWCKDNGTSAQKVLEAYVRMQVSEGSLVDKETKVRQLDYARLLEDGITWPVGNLTPVCEEDRQSLKLPTGVCWCDEIGNYFNEDLAVLVDGVFKYAGGAGAYKYTLLPAIKRGWRPNISASPLTVERAAHVLGVINAQEG